MQTTLQKLTEDTSIGRRKMTTNDMNQIVSVSIVTRMFWRRMSPYLYKRKIAKQKDTRDSTVKRIGATT